MHIRIYATLRDLLGVNAVELPLPGPRRCPYRA